MANPNEESFDWLVKSPKTKHRLAHLLRSQEWNDCSFQFPTNAGAGDSKNCLFAHKLILAMASPVFADMFYGDVGDKESPVIISDIDQPTFTALLEYIYTEEVEIPDTKAAINLYNAAKKYILVNLEKKCLNFLSKALKDPNHACQIYEFAIFHGEKLLEEKCIKIFSTEIQSVLNSSSFRHADINTVKKIVSLDALDINEIELFNAVLDYAKNFNTSDDSDSDDSHNLASQHKTCKMDLGERKIEVSHSSTRKPEDARRILKGIIEEIRFLSMTPADLAKIGENIITHTLTVLSKEEIIALLINKLLRESSVPMPDRFSCKREPRRRSVVIVKKFSWTFCNVTGMTIGEQLNSPPYYVSNLIWIVAAVKRFHFSAYLGLTLKCSAHLIQTVSQNWSCKAKVELRLLSVNPVTEPVIKRFEHTFCTESDVWIEKKFIECDLIDPKNNYIKDGSFTVEVHLETGPVQYEEWN